MPDFTGDPKAHDISEFKDGLSGTCLCGSIKVTINDPDLFTGRRGHLCHCANCRKISGSFLQSNLIIEPEKVTIEDTQNTRRVYDDVGGSGNAVHRNFCSKCGAPICSIADAYPGKMIVKMGIFPRIPEPEYEGFGEHRQAWEGSVNDGTKVYQFTPKGPLLSEVKK